MRESVGVFLGLLLKVEDQTVFGIIDSATQVMVLSTHIAKKFSFQRITLENIRFWNAQECEVEVN